jgi:osmotically-inducible protein OsmY
MRLKRLGACLAAAALVAFSSAVASAGVKDSWITTKAKIALLASDGLSVKGANVDTHDGVVAIHGKVKTEADKIKAGDTVSRVDGVKSVTNLLQVVPEFAKDEVSASDSDIKDRVKDAIKADRRLDDIKVASVNNGLVLLTGKAHGQDEKLAAIEIAYTSPGVIHVATEIETIEN